MKHVFLSFILLVSIILQAVSIGVIIANKIDIEKRQAIEATGWVLLLVYLMLR